MTAVIRVTLGVDPGFWGAVLSDPIVTVADVSTSVVTQAFRFALDPTPSQARDLERNAGGARFAFNWALAAVKANMEQRAAERSYGLLDEDLTPALRWNLPALRFAWNQAKRQVAPWWAGCSKEAFNTGLDGVARALNNFGDSKTGRRAGSRVGFPRFKTRRRTTPSIRFTTGAIRVEPDRHHVTLPRIGRIKTHESTRKLARRLEAGTARILSATARREGRRWFCAFTVEIVRAASRPTHPDQIIGVDVGISNLAVLSNGEVVPNPRHLNAAMRKLRRMCRAVSRRTGADRRTARQPSKRWLKANQQRNKVHHRVSAQRRDRIHKLTTRLAATFGSIVIEDLNLAGMLRNRRLARSISDAGHGEFRRQLGYKTTWNGGRLVVASRWYPSSKTCSGCGLVKPKLPLNIRTFACHACGLVIDRDHNAAINLKQVAQSGWETINGRGADRKTGPCPAGGWEAPIPRQKPGQDGNRTPATADCR